MLPSVHVTTFLFFFFQAEDGIRDHCVTGVQTCALPISPPRTARAARGARAVRGGASLEHLRAGAGAAPLGARGRRRRAGGGLRRRELSPGTRGSGRLSPGPP